MKFIILAFMCLMGINTIYGETLKDDFSTKQLDWRLLQRGPWNVEGNIASVKFDQKLFEKYENHGPIIRWRNNYNEAQISFEVKGSDCKKAVLTLDGDGHIFRVIMGYKPRVFVKGKPKSSSCIISWGTKSSKENKGDIEVVNGLPGVDTLNNKWVKVKLDIKGETGTLQIGDFVHKMKHRALARAKKMVSFSFSKGTLSIRNFSLTKN